VTGDVDVVDPAGSSGSPSSPTSPSSAKRRVWALVLARSASFLVTLDRGQSLEQSAEDVCGRLVGGLQKVRVTTERGRCRGVAQPAGDGSDVDARRQQASSRR